MADEKDRFGEAMKLAERAKEDIYFAEQDRELIEKLKTNLEKVDKGGQIYAVPNAPASWRRIPLRDSPWTAARTAAGSGWIKANSKA